MTQLFNTGVVVSRGNSTTISLAPYAEFLGTTDDVTSYEEIDINVAGSPNNAASGLYFEFSPDGIHWDVSVLIGGAYLTGPNIVPQHLRVVLPFFRVRYVNGPIQQTEFRLTTVYHRTTGTRLTRYLNQTLDNTEDVLLTRSVIDGYRPDQTYGNIRATSTNALITSFDDDAHIDAFSRLRISEPQTLFDSKQLVDNQPLFWDDQQTSGSGTSSTYNTNQASSTLSVSNLTAGTRIRQTFQRYNYQPGKSLAIFMTGILGSGASGITKRVGYFDGYNGIFFQLSGTTLGIGLRTKTSGSPVDTIINQSSWNVDTLDGYGPSGIVLDITKTQIFIIDLQWLGVGRIRFGFDLNGQIHYFHYINNANNNPLVYMSIPNLPLRYEINNDGTGGAASLVHICSTVISEGGRSETGPVFAVDTGATALTTLNNASIYPLLVIRLKSNYQMAQIDPIAVNIINTSADTFRFCLLLNPTIIGTALSFSSVSNSAVEYATPTSATTVSGGQQISSSYALGSGNGASATSNPINTNVASDLRIGSNIAGLSDILVLGVQRISGTTVSFYGNMSWRESI